MFDIRKLKSQMTYKDMTQEQLAEKLEISRSTLNKKLSNPNSFTHGELDKLVEILGIQNPEDIFFAHE